MCRFRNDSAWSCAPNLRRTPAPQERQPVSVAENHRQLTSQLLHLLSLGWRHGQPRLDFLSFSQRVGAGTT